jgi:hypothetical protein
VKVEQKWAIDHKIEHYYDNNNNNSNDRHKLHIYTHVLWCLSNEYEWRWRSHHHRHYHYHYKALTQSDVLHRHIRSRWEYKYHFLTQIFFYYDIRTVFLCFKLLCFLCIIFMKKKLARVYVGLSVHPIHWWWLSPSFNSNICVLLLKYHYILKLECWEEKTIKYNIWKKNRRGK